MTTVLASLAAGLRVVCMHPAATEAEIRRGIELSGAVALLGEQHDRHATSQPSREPGAVILGSSGTTGGPRMAVRCWDSLLADGRAVAQGLALTPDDRLVVSVPICHSYGMDLLMGCVVSGAAMTLVERATPLSLAAAAADATILPTVPFQLEQLLRSELGAHSIRSAVSAGSWLPESVWRLARERLGIFVGQLYGATELGTVSVRLGTDRDKAGTIAVLGPAVGDASLIVVDRSDPSRRCDACEEGELLVRARSMASCYVDGPLTMVDGYWRTGDAATRDASGDITLTGRWKLFIDVGGFKVNPIEVERVIATCPGVAACVVVPMRASDTVERLRALVVPSDRADPVSEDVLRSFVRERLSAAKVPRVFERVDSLPRSMTGKST